MMLQIKKTIAFFLLVVTCRVTVHSQQTVLDKYIQEAFKNNQGLVQKNIDLTKSLYALDEAKSYYLPQISVMANYTKASGGRTIDIPVGDLLNPVYATLNQLTQSGKFPQVANQSVLLNPNNFYDAKVHTTMPLINTEIWYAKKIRQESITAQQAAINVYKRSLVKDIKNTYYLYYQSLKSVEIYEAQLQLVNQNIRMNESWLKNGVRNRTSLTRAQSEQQKVFSNITQAKNAQRNAQAYFNFLLNKPLTSDIVLDSLLVQLSMVETTIDSSKVKNRDELKQINQVQNVAVLQQKMQQSYLVPKLNTFLDIGSQDYNFNVNNKSFYYLFGIGLQWDIFSFGQKKAKIQQAKADVANLEAQYNQTEASLQLELTTAYNNYQSALSTYQSAVADMTLAEKYYRDQLRVYQEGQLLYIELLDAQNQLTQAKMQSNISQAQVLTRVAEIERAEATYPLENISVSNK